LESALEKTKVSLYEEKARHRHQLTEEELRRKKLEEEIHDLDAWILELDNERKTAETETRKVTKNSFAQRKSRTVNFKNCARKLRQGGQRRMN